MAIIKNKLLFLIIVLLTAVCASAQDVAVEEWLDNLRPEHYDGGADTMRTNGIQHLGMRRIGSTQTAPLKAYGVQRVPVVLAAFADMAFSAADSTATDEAGNVVTVKKGTDEAVNAFYQKFCNGTMDGKLYKGHGSYGSIRDYFVEQSDSVFFPEFTVIGPVKLDSCYAYYGQNQGSNKDKHYSDFSNEAIRKAMEVYNNWDTFDNDGNGTIDMVFFIYAGLGENTSKNPDHIWPKETTRSETINGKVFATNAATSEARPAKTHNEKVVVGTDTTSVRVIDAIKTDGVGVFIHELSHALGLPDFYDTVGKSFGMDLWSVMDYGEYANQGYTPGNYTAYERDFMGWRRLKMLEEPCVLTLSCFADGGYGYRINNEANPQNEYYIIENRQSKGWDTSIGRLGHGLQVTHVDFDSWSWNNNKVNTNPDHQRMTIIAANDNYTGTYATDDSKVWAAAIAGQLFPGDMFNYDLTDETTPAAEVFTGVLMHKPIRNITENEDSTVTICFRTNGILGTPVVNEAENIKMDQFDASWVEVDHATKYVCELYMDSLLIRQDTIAETSHHYDELLPSSDLKLRVMAFADSPEDYLESEWSDFCYLSTLSDYIENVSASDKVVDVYALNGILVSHCKADALGRLSLRRGIYIVKYSNGAAKRILIN